MIDVSGAMTESEATTTQLSRVVGRHRGELPGPKLIVLGGIHGNEPAGLAAARRVLARLEKRPFRFRGEFVALAGNLRALSRGQRYLGTDLNRLWTEERLGALAAHPDAAPIEAEALEQRELLAALDDELWGSRSATYFIDLHTTSAAGIPFVLIGDTLRHREFAAHFPLPVILGLEEQVDGVLLEFMTERGCVTLGCEGGQHDDERSVDNLEAVLWVALEAAGLVEKTELEGYAAAYARLDQVRGGLPRVMEVLSRHAIKPEHGFRMEPGFANIQAVARGTLLASDRRGEIRAKRDGVVFLPLYQGKGDDGFFFGRPLPNWWVRVSARLRQLHLERVLPLLPGVRRDRVRRDVLHVDTRIARFYPLEVFHTFGFRKIRQAGRKIVFARRRSA